MNRAGLLCKGILIAGLTLILAPLLPGSVAFAQAPAAAAGGGPVWHYLGAALGVGIIVVGAGFGIGKLAAAAADGIARQPSAAAQIVGAVNLPLFLLEGVAIIAEVVVLLVVLAK
jgi:F-type H+-transporting ATPase subunit c